MFGTAAYNRDPVEGPEESPVVKEQRLRNWIRKQTLREERLEFNKDFPAVNERFQARHDSDFLLPDAYAQLRPVPTQPELHGMYSSAMIGSTVPGYIDPRLSNAGVVGNSDLVSSNLERGTGSIGMVPRAPQWIREAGVPKCFIIGKKVSKICRAIKSRILNEIH